MKPKTENKLLSIFQESLGTLMPEELFGGMNQPLGARLYWGKAALRTWAALDRTPDPELVIAPRGHPEAVHGSNPEWLVLGEHPLPGKGSFEAGSALFEFFSGIQRSGVKQLNIFLSGGASSLAWCLPAGETRESLFRKLRDLYARPLSIDQLNRYRSPLCGLKGGGAAYWLKKIAPDVRARVYVISDVEPFGPEVVGSGPFWAQGRSYHLPHVVVAGNQSWVRSVAKVARQKRLMVLSQSAGRLGFWNEWSRDLIQATEAALKKNQEGLLIQGGEPAVKLPRGHVPRIGGRQTQVAASLLARFWDEIVRGELEILCGSSDGVDGHSGGAGVYLHAGNTPAPGERGRGSLQKSLVEFQTGAFFRKTGQLIPARYSGTNVQDVVLISVRSASRSSRNSR